MKITFAFFCFFLFGVLKVNAVQLDFDGFNAKGYAYDIGSAIVDNCTDVQVTYAFVSDDDYDLPSIQWSKGGSYLPLDGYCTSKMGSEVLPFNCATEAPGELHFSLFTCGNSNFRVQAFTLDLDCGDCQYELTASPTPSVSSSPSPTPSSTPSSTSSSSSTQTGTATATSTSTHTASPTPSTTSTETASSTPSNTNTGTTTATPTSSTTSTPSFSSTNTGTLTATPTNTATRTPSVTPTRTSSSTNTATPSTTESLTPTPSTTETSTATSTSTTTATNTPTTTPTASPTPQVALEIVEPDSGTQAAIFAPLCIRWTVPPNFPTGISQQIRIVGGGTNQIIQTISYNGNPNQQFQWTVNGIVPATYIIRIRFIQLAQNIISEGFTVGNVGTSPGTTC